jgi:hypothetical protein
MNTATHPVAPEELMAFLDGELTASEAHAVSAHLESCAPCARLANQFRATSQSLTQWTVPPAPSSLEDSVNDLAVKTASNPTPPKSGRPFQISFWNWKLWAIGAGGAVTAVLVFVAFAASMMYRDHPRDLLAKPSMAAPTPEASKYASPRVENEQTASMKGKLPAGFGIAQMESLAASKPVPQAGGGGGDYIDPTPPPQSAPMIARSVSLTIVVKDFSVSRASLENILGRHHGYAAQLTAATPENAPRNFQASLRIPAPELASALTDLKALGHVENESQSGEEVTQQHADLVARLENSRETEDRLRAILQQRTGKIEDVLQVEEEIARVRGEIEQMEAEQKALEHRIDFATIDLQLTEEYKAQLDASSPSVSNRIHNALVDGLRNASATLLGIMLFFEEFGPVLLIWLVILGFPIFLVIRRYRKMRAGL